LILGLYGDENQADIGEPNIGEPHQLSCHGTRLLFALLKRKIALLQCMALQNPSRNEREKTRHLRALGPTTLSATWIA